MSLSLTFGFDLGRRHAVPPNGYCAVIAVRRRRDARATLNRAVFAEFEMGGSEEFGSWEFEVSSLGNGSRGRSPHRFWLSAPWRGEALRRRLDLRHSTGFRRRPSIKGFGFSCHLPLVTCHPFWLAFGWFGLLRHAQIN